MSADPVMTADGAGAAFGLRGAMLDAAVAAGALVPVPIGGGRRAFRVRELERISGRALATADADDGRVGASHTPRRRRAA